jgi:ribosomal protein S27AE
VRGFEKDGCIVKVLGKRISNYWTAYYQLNHSTIRTNVKRPHACTWFGVCSYRKLKVKVEKKKELCPICGEDLVKLHHLGVRRIVKEKDKGGFCLFFC